MRELTIPPDAFDAENAQEFLRFWVIDGVDQVSVHVGAMGDLEVRQWGMIIADLTKHIIRALRLYGSALTEDELRAQIERAYIARLAEGLSISGSLLGNTTS